MIHRNNPTDKDTENCSTHKKIITRISEETNLSIDHVNKIIITYFKKMSKLIANSEIVNFHKIFKVFPTHKRMAYLKHKKGNKTKRK